jgi:hypothetical protein
MPNTASVPGAAARVSTRMPPSLPPPATRSLGHFSSAGAPSARSARAVATPATRASAASSRAGRLMTRAREKVRPSPGALCQRRPRRPRPAVCSAAISSTGAAGPASRNRTVLVELQRPTRRTSTPGIFMGR